MGLGHRKKGSSSPQIPHLSHLQCYSTKSPTTTSLSFFLHIQKFSFWCTFHKTNSHHSTDCRLLKNICNTKTLMAKVNSTDLTELPETISLDNPTEADPSLILMTKPEPGHPNIPLFTHNCQIKTKLATLILDNGSQKNLISQDLVQHLQLPTTPHPDPYHLGWVKREVLTSLLLDVALSLSPLVLSMTL
jgi:hypothetical protein